MKICVLGLDCAAPEIVLGDERLRNLRRLMQQGPWGRLESVIPPITVPAWMCMATSQDPGSLGVYGFRNSTDYSYRGLGVGKYTLITEQPIGETLASHGKTCVVIGVPPSYPTKPIHGVRIGCFL